jgi:predicted AAA+ superfamily ATPase
MLLELSYPTTVTKLPIVADMRKKPKLLWLDTGLLNYAAGIQSELFGKDDINDAWRGKIAEHIVGQEILSASNKFLDERSFWVREARNAQAEVDYLYNSRQYGLVPIEVKSGNNAHLKSLQLFMQESSSEIAIRFWNNSFSVDDITLPNGKQYKLFNLPYYYAGSIEPILNKYSIKD